MKTLPKNSLRKLSTDSRDFNLGAVFKQIDIKDVPTTDFVVAQPLMIKDQGETDYCSAYALTSVSEDQEGVELLPEYQFFKTKVISGRPQDWGADLRDACKSATHFGSLPRGDGKLVHPTRESIVDKNNWPEQLDSYAKNHKKNSYFKVTGKYDVFDNIRTALWQHRKNKCSILTGALWRSSWLDVQDGIIPPIYEDDGFGHAFKIFGQKVIKERLYLVAQLSQGDKVGDGGLFYLSREVVNKEIGPFGMFMFVDIPKGEVIKDSKSSVWENIISIIKSIYVQLFKKSIWN